MKQRSSSKKTNSIGIGALIGTGLLVLAGCVVPAREASPSASTPTSDSSRTAATTTAASSAPPTSVANDVEASTPPTTAAAPNESTAVPTTVPRPLDCAEFVGATAFRQMQAVANGAAPQADECAGAIATAAAANATFTKSSQLNAEFGIGEWIANSTTLFPGLGCDGAEVTSDVTNTFDVSIIVWGAAYFLESADADLASAQIELFVSDVIEPGASVSLGLEADRPSADLVCGFDTRVLIAPVGEMAADAGFVAADAAGPQSSADATVWLPALRASEDEFATDFSPDLAVAAVEDVHSPDLAATLSASDPAPDDGTPQPGEIEYLPAAAPPTTVAPETTAVCSATDVTEGRDEGGQLVLVVFRASTAVEDTRGVAGLFRRGSDGVWRYVGRALRFPAPLFAGASCDGAPTM